MDCFKDKALLTAFGFNIFVYAAVQIFMTFNQYIFLDYFGNTSLSGIASLVLFAAMMAAAPFASIFSKKIGKKEISVIGLALASIAYGVLWILRVKSVAVYFVVAFLTFFGLGLNSMVCYALANDCIDNHYLETGDKVDGTVYAMLSFVRKMAGAICTGIGGWGLALIHYDELAVVQTEAVQNGVFNIAIGMPTICFALTLVFLILFPLNKKKVEENNTRLAELKK